MDQDRPGWAPPPADSIADVPLSPTSHLASASTPARRSRTGKVIAVAAVSIGALGIAGTAYAASTTPTPTPSSGSGSSPGAPSARTPGQAPAQGMPGHKGRDGMGPGFGMRGFGMGIHSVTTVPKQGGGYQTVHTQTGTVSDVSTSAITVKSEDGYSKEYVVTADTVVNAKRDGIGSIKSGDTVVVIGIESDGKVTAIHIMDRTAVKDGLAPLAPPKPAGTGGASPSTSGSTA